MLAANGDGFNAARAIRPSQPVQVATFAMFVDAGSMYENQSELGACHFLESTSFKSTEKRSAADVLSFQMANGMGSSAVFNREVVMYKVDTLRNNSEAAVDLLSDAVQHPKFRCVHARVCVCMCGLQWRTERFT